MSDVAAYALATVVSVTSAGAVTWGLWSWLAPEPLEAPEAEPPVVDQATPEPEETRWLVQYGPSDDSTVHMVCLDVRRDGMPVELICDDCAQLLGVGHGVRST